jgi:hypothetical protein
MKCVGFFLLLGAGCASSPSSSSPESLASVFRIATQSRDTSAIRQMFYPQACNRKSLEDALTMITSFTFGDVRIETNAVSRGVEPWNLEPRCKLVAEFTTTNPDDVSSGSIEIPIGVMHGRWYFARPRSTL